jgi:hypothetical protein
MNTSSTPSAPSLEVMLTQIMGQFQQQQQSQQTQQSHSQQSQSTQPQSTQLDLNLLQMLLTPLYQQVQQQQSQQTVQQQQQYQLSQAQQQQQSQQTQVQQQQHSQQPQTQQQQHSQLSQTQQRDGHRVIQQQEADDPSNIPLREDDEYDVVLPANFQFHDIPQDKCDKILQNGKGKRVFNASIKSELVRIFATQAFLDRKEFYYRRQNAPLKNALREYFPHLSDNLLKNLIQSMKDYVRNHWTKKGCPYHAMWVQEKNAKHLKYNNGKVSTQKNPNKSKGVTKPKIIKMPQIRKTSQELKSVQMELKRLFSEWSKNPDDQECIDSIALQLESTYYDRLHSLRSGNGNYTFKGYINDHPVLTIDIFLYFEWKLMKTTADEASALEYDDFEQKVKDMTKMMAYFMIHHEEQDTLLEQMENYFNDKARRNLKARDVVIDEDSLQFEVDNMHKETALLDLLQSDECNDYIDHLLIALIFYIEDKWKVRDSNNIIVECATTKTSLSTAHIAAMNKRPDGLYRKYVVMIDKTVVFEDESLLKVFIMYYCACDIGARAFGSFLLKTFIDEAIVGEVRNRISTYRSFIAKLTTVYENEDQVRDLFPDFYQFLNRKKKVSSAPVFDRNRVLALLVDKPKQTKQSLKKGKKKVTKKKKKQTEKEKKKQSKEQQKKGKKRNKKQTEDSDHDDDPPAKKRKKTTDDMELDDEEDIDSISQGDKVELYLDSQYYGIGTIFKCHTSSKFKVHHREYSTSEYYDIQLDDIDGEFTDMEVDGIVPEVNSRVPWRIEDTKKYQQTKRHAQQEQEEEEEQEDEEQHEEEDQGAQQEEEEEEQEVDDTRHSKRAKIPTACHGCGNKLTHKYCCDHCSRYYCEGCASRCASTKCFNIVCMNCGTKCRSKWKCVNCK